MKSLYTLADLEAAINFWRNKIPSTGEEQSLCAQAAALAEPYALLIFNAQREIAADALSVPALDALRDFDATNYPESPAPPRP